MKLAALALLFFCALFQLPAQTDPYQNEVITRINNFRGSNHLPPLSADPYLTEVAQIWAKEMLKKGSLVHRKNLPLVMEKAGYSSINENIFYTTYPLSAELTVNAWINSPGHRKNLLAPNMKLVGIGYAQGANNAKYAVFNSAAKAAPAPAALPAN